MSYARSPRPVCSMTIGTSITCSFRTRSHTPAPINLASVGGGSGYSRGLMVQIIEGLFVADSVPDSIQHPFLCQTSADAFHRLFRLLRKSFDLAIDLLVSDFNFFLVGDLFQQHGCFQFLHRLLTLTRAQPV